MVNDRVAGPREVVSPLNEDNSTALEMKKSLSEIPADEKVAKGTLGTLKAMQLEQTRDAIDALIRQRDALRNNDPAARSVAGIECALSLVQDVADGFRHTKQRGGVRGHGDCHSAREPGTPGAGTGRSR